ncbi:MAG: DUF1080 domain-containing protein [Verrucomicrobiales bacterium]|nr:DUF1080 domain-containing protein [Verrucomicrobiales bacterium]
MKQRTWLKIGLALTVLASQSEAAEAVVLFDGSSLDAFSSKDGGPPAPGWVIEDGALHRAEKAGDLISKAEFSDFQLDWEWKVGEGGNSGVKYWVTPIKGQMLGLEYQLIDDERHSDAKKGGNRQTAALYDIKAPNADKPVRKAGEWNTSRIVVKGGGIQHWLNGELVMEIDTQSEDWKQRLAASKYQKYEGFAPGHGHILLQDHQDPVWFRNIRVTDLSE